MDGAWKGQIDAYFEQNRGRFDEIEMPTQTDQKNK